MLATETQATTVATVATFKQWIGVKTNLTKTITALSSVGTVATAICPSHGYQTNAFVVIAGADPSAYNGAYLITVVDANTFTFNLAATTTSPANGTITVTPDDGRYAAMLDGATAEFERETDIYLVQRSVTETFDGNNKTRHALAWAPVVSIDSFTIDGATVNASAYTIKASNGIITFTSGAFSWGVQNVVVTYTAGYDVKEGPALPQDVVRAILDLGKAMHDELVSNAIAATSISLGASTMVIKPSKRPQSVQRVFDAWEAAGMRA